MKRIQILLFLILSIISPIAGFATDSGNEVEFIEGLFPLAPGTEWIYRDSDNQYEKRWITGLQELEVPGFAEAGKKLQFIEMKILRGDRKQIISKKTIPAKEKHTIQEETFYFLKTSRGLLRSSALGPAAKNFWSQAFLLIPTDFEETKNWISMVHGSRLSFKVKGRENFKIPLGTQKGCWVVQYQHGLELDGKGKIYYCPGLGETKVSEEDFQRELIEFHPAQKKAAMIAGLSEEDTQKIWGFLPQQETIHTESPLFEMSGEVEPRRVWALSLFWVSLLSICVFLVAGIGYFLRRVRMDEVKGDGSEVHDLLQQVNRDRQKGQLQESLDTLKGLILKYPNYADVHFHLGCVYQDLQQEEDAIQSFKKAVKINSKYLEAHRCLAKLLREKGSLEDALSCFRVILIQRPDYADIHNEAGEIHRELGNKDKARKHFEQALAINPHFSIARQNLQQI